MGETKCNISFVYHLFLVSFFVIVIVEYIQTWCSEYTSMWKKVEINQKGCFWKKITEWCNKDKKIQIQVLTKDFTKRVFKKTKVMQIFKPINYWEIAANTGST